MTALTRRLATLESTNKVGRDFILILRKVLPCRESGPWTATLYGQQIDSEPGETEQDFGSRLHGLAQERRPTGKHAAVVVMASHDVNL